MWRQCVHGLAHRDWWMRKAESRQICAEPTVALQDAGNGHVLVVATRDSDTERICQMLSDSGYQPRHCNNCAAAEAVLDEIEPLDEVIATVICHRVPSRDEGCQAEQANRPDHLPPKLHGKRIIVLSDCMAESTVVSLLQEGAHQCFDLREPPRILQARLNAALRRHGRTLRKQLIQGDIRFDLEKRFVTRGGELVDLSPKEFELAYYLFSNRGRVVENSELMTSIWSLPPTMDTRRIDTAACRVRKKLQLAESHGWQLKRLRCVGYWLVHTEGV